MNTPLTLTLAALAAVTSASFATAAGSQPSTHTNEPAYLRYAHPTVREPFPDGVDLTVPVELGDPRTAALGWVDVTKPPFSADATGGRDATAALQQAINFARDHQMVCFFPSGTYRVSDTLTCVQQLYRRANGRVFGAPLWPCVLMGSRAGKERPKILLAPRSPGFGDPQHPKYVVHFWARGYANPTTAERVTDGRGPEQDQPNISMNQMFVNLDITIGEGNAGAVALRHQAAEGSAVEDCTIDATCGLTGLEGAIGSGGSSSGVTVIGGRLGLDFRTSQPAPVITGFTLIGQTETALRYSGRQTLVAVGLRIVAKGNAGPLIAASGGDGKLFLQGPDQPMQGQVSLVDSEIVFEPAAGNTRVALRSNRSLYLNNVFVRGATMVVTAPDDAAGLAGNPDGWLRVLEYAHGAKFGGRGNLQYRYPVYLDGARLETNLASVVKGEAPPADLQSRHLWPREFPSGESPAAANVKSAPFNARGDGTADDTAALQRAVNERDLVFLPKGYYRISKTIELRPRSQLVGVGQHLSVLVATRPEGDFANAAKPAPLVRTADSADAATVLAFCGLWAPANLINAFALHWRSGGRSVFRAVEFLHAPMRLGAAGRGSPPAPRHHPIVLVTGHGGGNWYNFREGGEYAQAPDFRLLLIDGTRAPLNFYQCSPQHVSSDFAMELRHAQNVSLFGTKYEGSAPMLRAADCAQLRLFGHGGNGKPVAGSSLFQFERCRDFTVANAVEGPTKIGEKSLSHRRGGTDPRQWSMLAERSEAGVETKTTPLDRPVLYRRGAPSNPPAVNFPQRCLRP
ncbi:MAG: hypothetical protein HZA90_10470 [Verrucomicrobia bacterium]|nr:hypothetical protein [Verrucomicrobiota bacterium]